MPMSLVSLSLHERTRSKHGDMFGIPFWLHPPASEIRGPNLFPPENQIGEVMCDKPNGLITAWLSLLVLSNAIVYAIARSDNVGILH